MKKNEELRIATDIQHNITTSMLDITNKIGSLPLIRASLKSEVDDHFIELIQSLTERKNALYQKIDQYINSLCSQLQKAQQTATSNSQTAINVINFVSQLSGNICGNLLEQLKLLPPIENVEVLPSRIVFSGALIRDVISQEGQLVIGKETPTTPRHRSASMGDASVLLRNSCKMKFSSGSIVAGSGNPGYKEGKGVNAFFSSPTGVTFNSHDNTLYVADYANHRIRIIAPQGEVLTFSGSGESGWSDGISTAAKFCNPRGIALNHMTGDLYVTDSTNRIRRISPHGIVSTLAGNGNAGCNDGNDFAATFSSPVGIDIDQRDGSVYVADWSNHKIRKITPDGVVITVAGSSLGFQDGFTFASQFRHPLGICVDPNEGDIYVADSHNHRIRKISSGVVSTIAGSGQAGGIDGMCDYATFNNPTDVKIFSGDRSMYVADYGSNKVRRIYGGIVTTVSYTDDKNVNTTFFGGPISLSIDEKNRVCYVVEHSTHRIKKFFLE